MPTGIGYDYLWHDQPYKDNPNMMKLEFPITNTGMKHDKGKLLAGILLEDFPYAIEGVMQIATFGAAKYARSSWQTVPNALQRYNDAFMRHQIEIGKGIANDAESGMPHIWHIGWNALAISELMFNPMLKANKIK